MRPLPAPISVLPTGRVSIYAVRRRDNGAIKIGRSVDFPARLNDLQVACDVELEVVVVFRASERDERRIHRMFADCHKRGEWFHPRPHLLCWLAQQVEVCS